MMIGSLVLCIIVLIIGFSILHLICVIGQLLASEFITKNELNPATINIAEYERKTTILVPVCNESQSLLEATIKKIQKMDGLFTLVVIENSRERIIKKKIVHLCKTMKVECISIPNLGNKAKAINYYLRNCPNNSNYIAVFDVDQQPKPNFLLELLPRIVKDPKVALIQTPQKFRNKNDNLLSRCYSSMLDVYFYGIVLSRSHLEHSTCLGTNFIVKKEALIDIGYFDEDCLTEDVATSFHLSMYGYRILYCGQALATGLAPNTMRALFVQAKRYVIGNNQVALMVLRNLLQKYIGGYKFYDKFCYLHSSLSLSVAGFSVFVNSFLYLVFEKQFALVQLSCAIVFILLVCFKLKRVDILIGIFLFSILSPIYFLAGLSLLSYNNNFKITPKKDKNPWINLRENG